MSGCCDTCGSDLCICAEIAAAEAQRTARCMACGAGCRDTRDPCAEVARQQRAWTLLRGENARLHDSLYGWSPFCGPCAHGHDPWDRCDECGEGTALDAAAKAASAARERVAHLEACLAHETAVGEIGTRRALELLARATRLRAENARLRTENTALSGLCADKPPTKGEEQKP